MTDQATTDQSIKLHEECGLQATFKNGQVHDSFIEGGVAIVCFLPVGHVYTRHHARIGEEQLIVEWGPDPRKKTQHVCGAPGHYDCELMGHTPPTP